MVDALRDLKPAATSSRSTTSRYREAASRARAVRRRQAHCSSSAPSGLTRAGAARLRPYPGKVLADKLGTHPEHEFCVDAGLRSVPGLLLLPAGGGRHPQHLAPTASRCSRSSPRCSDPTSSSSDLEQLIARDVALSFRMLRYVNSAFFGLRGEVRSIGQALALLGLDNARRWATLSVAGQRRRQADGADAHRADPRALLRARRRAARIAQRRRAVHARAVLRDRRAHGHADARRGRVASARRRHARGAGVTATGRWASC